MTPILEFHDIVRSFKKETPVLRLPRTIVNPKLPQHQIRSGGQGESRKSVDTSVLADPVAVARMMRVRVVGVSGQPGLARGEETAL
jgi:hypothetical protein